MKAFAELYTRLDQTNKTNAKVQLLTAFFRQAEPEDALWVLALFTGRRPKRILQVGLVRQWAAGQAGIATWLFEESYHIVGDLAETISLVLPPPTGTIQRSLAGWIRELTNLEQASEEEKRQWLLHAWSCLEPAERFILIKLLTGGFRVGVSENLVIRAVAEAFGLEQATVAHRLMGNWHPERTTLQALLAATDTDADRSRPYPFCLAHPLEDHEPIATEPAAWCAEWKWDGIRGQLIRRGGELFVWSRGEELMTEKFPEFAYWAMLLPEGTVMDGEILAFDPGQPGIAPQPFADLQTRIGRKNVTKAILKKTPVAFIAYDLLEWSGADIRQLPFSQRRKLLEEALQPLAGQAGIRLSPLFRAGSEAELNTLRAGARAHRAEGLMLKHQDSAYQAGRKRGLWWKWKLEPYSIDAVLVYAQKGHGRRAGLYTDYSFAVWHQGELVVFAKAYSGLTDAEIRQVDRFIRLHTLEKFGPVRTVSPQLVFEIGFEGITRSARHKSGVAIRFPRILRWRTDKTPEQANHLADLQQLLGTEPDV